MSFFPSSSDGLANIIGVGALIGALSGAKAPRNRSGKPGLLTTLLKSAQEQEAFEMERKAKQDAMTQQFLSQMLYSSINSGIAPDPAMLERASGLFNIPPEAFANMAMENNRKGSIPFMEKYAATMSPELLRGFTTGKYADMQEIFASPEGRAAVQNSLVLPALIDQMGSPNGLAAMAYLSEADKASMKEKMFNDAVSSMGIFSGGFKNAGDYKDRQQRGIIGYEQGQIQNTERLRHQLAMDRLAEGAKTKASGELVENVYDSKIFSTYVNDINDLTKELFKMGDKAMEQYEPAHNAKNFIARFTSTIAPIYSTFKQRGAEDSVLFGGLSNAAYILGADEFKTRMQTAKREGYFEDRYMDLLNKRNAGNLSEKELVKIKQQAYVDVANMIRTGMLKEADKFNEDAFTLMEEQGKYYPVAIVVGLDKPITGEGWW